jgi:Ca2+-binding RTX toxin-like protein
LRNIRGAEAIYADQTSLVIEDARLGLDYGARGVESGTLTLDFGSATSNTLSLISEDANVTFKAATDPQNAAITAIELEAAGTNRAEEQVDISAFNEIERLTITGENALVLDLTSPNLTEIDATQNTGGVELNDLNSASQDVEFLGSQGDDLVRTGTGNDTITGNDGDDDIDAEAGDDSIEGGQGDDTLDGNAGADTLLGGEGDDLMRGAGGADLIEGGDGDDTIFGGNNADELSGGDGDDEIRGGGGADTIEGGSGENLLFGGGGADRFVFADGTDTVQDFTAGQDTLVFSDGTTLSSQEDFTALRESDPELFQNVGADSITLGIGGATVTLAEFDTDFLG